MPIALNVTACKPGLMLIVEWGKHADQHLCFKDDLGMHKRNGLQGCFAKGFQHSSDVSTTSRQSVQVLFQHGAAASKHSF